MSLKSLGQQWFMIALATVFPLGFFGSKSLSFITDQTGLQSGIVFVVMALMALPVPLAWVKKALGRPWPAILASLINMGLFPILALAASTVLDPYLAGGLVVAATIPCTLASAAVWTNRAGGDDTIAVLVTLITNLSCVVVTPVWLVLLLGKTTHLDLAYLINSLLILVLLPMVIAQLARRNPSVAAWSTRNKKLISTICQTGILTMVFLGSVQMGQRMSVGEHERANSIVQVAMVILLACALHLVVLAIGWFLADATRIARPQKIAVAIAGSQKTLMVGLKLSIDCGVSILPMIVYHISQLVLDTLLADRWRRAGEIDRPEELD